jgi:hypothetical protein
LEAVKINPAAPTNRNTTQMLIEVAKGVTNLDSLHLQEQAYMFLQMLSFQTQ